ncbi:MAG: Ig-like domain-containing protein [Cyclobacteriaceae bacterium]|nr:Ig-like domain-containing protein [Cyclobacteriaceae bacterium]
MKKLKFFGVLLFIAGMTTFISCDDDDDDDGGPNQVTISSIIATGTDLQTGDQNTVDLNEATAATDVPVDAVIAVTFSRSVDPTTITESNITLNNGTSNVDIDLASSGSMVNISPSGEMERGTQHTLTLSGSIQAEDGGNLASVTRNFTTAGRKDVVPPQVENMIAYWKFDGDASDEMGMYDASAEVSVDYAEDRFGQLGSTAQFDGDESIIEVPNGDALIDTDDFTISFWMKTNSENHVNAEGNPIGHFVLGLGAFMGIQFEIFDDYHGAKFAISYELENGDAESEDMWFPAEATDNTTGGWQGWTFARSVSPEQMELWLKDNWLHVVYTYDASEKIASLYYDGEIMKTFDFDLWPDDAPKRTVVGLKYRGAEPDVVNELAFGFVHSRAGTMWDSEPWGSYDLPTAKHFKGMLDDVRIFHATLTDEEVEQLFSDESPQ